MLSKSRSRTTLRRSWQKPAPRSRRAPEVLDRWMRKPDAERLAKRREKEAKSREKERARVRVQLRSAKLTDRREGVGSGLMNEPVLVLGGPQHGDLEVFNQEADWVGVARHGSGGRLSELHDADGVCLLGIEGSGYVPTFVLKGHDGNEVSRIGAPTGSCLRRFVRLPRVRVRSAASSSQYCFRAAPRSRTLRAMRSHRFTASALRTTPSR